MRSLFLLLSFTTTAALFAAEIPKAQPVVRDEPTVKRAQPVAPRAATPVPVLAPPADGAIALLRQGDVFEMRLAGVPQEAMQDFMLQFTVGSNGNVNIPLIGDMRASGLTSGQLEKSIEQRLVAEKMFTHPTVNINLQIVTRMVTVGGAVRAPGRQQWTADMTLMSAIALAGGPDDFAGDKVNLVRNKETKTFSMRRLKKLPGEDPKLLPGDQVDLPK